MEPPSYEEATLRLPPPPTYQTPSEAPPTYEETSQSQFLVPYQRRSSSRRDNHPHVSSLHPSTKRGNSPTGSNFHFGLAHCNISNLLLSLTRCQRPAGSFSRLEDAHQRHVASLYPSNRGSGPAETASTPRAAASGGGDATATTTDHLHHPTEEPSGLRAMFKVSLRGHHRKSPVSLVVVLLRVYHDPRRMLLLRLLPDSVLHSQLLECVPLLSSLPQTSLRVRQGLRPLACVCSFIDY